MIEFLPAYAAYLPVFNGAATLPAVLSSLRDQSLPPDDILVVDNGSTDDSYEIARAANVIVLRFPRNRGRGAARARALEFLGQDFILSCDVGNRLEPDFAARALRHFVKEPRLAGVSGRVTQTAGGNLPHRWRGRHLFLGRPGPLQTRAPHNTSAAMVRRAAVMAAGNYREDLFAHEDSDLSNRFFAAGWQHWCDPAMVAHVLVENSLAGVFVRYARWYEPRERGWSFRDYPRNLRQALRIHLPDDLAAHDIPSALASLLLPHYLLWVALRGTRFTQFPDAAQPPPASTTA